MAWVPFTTAVTVGSSATEVVFNKEKSLIVRGLVLQNTSGVNINVDIYIYHYPDWFNDSSSYVYSGITPVNCQLLAGESIVFDTPITLEAGKDAIYAVSTDDAKITAWGVMR